MARRKLTVDRHEEIKRRLADGRSLREIATALGCSRRLVRQIRDGERLTHQTAASPDPLWMAQLEWPVIIHDLGLGHPMKFIWEERAKALITYPNFWKQFYRKFPQYREATITVTSVLIEGVTRFFFASSSRVFRESASVSVRDTGPGI
jgi:hypothetical protein